MFVFSHILGIIWINASHELCKKPIACFGMFVFSHMFHLLREFSFRNCMGFYFTWNRGVRDMQKTQTFRIIVFSHNFPVLSKFTIPMFWVLGFVWISASREICKKHLTLECCFLKLFSALSPMFWGQYYWYEDYWKIYVSGPIPIQTIMWNSSLRKST